MIVQPIEGTRSLKVLARAAPRALSGLATRAFAPERPRGVGLIGRDRELALLNALVEHMTETGSALLVRGAPGTGKSALVAALADDVQAKPVTVLWASGIRAEANLPYAGLHQLLRPILGELGSLPRPQRRAIESAFRMTASASPDPFMIAIATLHLLSTAARTGLVIVVEDAQWLDRRTSEVLVFVARRLASDPIVLLVTARDDGRSPILEAGLDELRLEGLAGDEAADWTGTERRSPQTATPASQRGDASGRSEAQADAAPNDLLVADIGRAIAGDADPFRLLLDGAPHGDGNPEGLAQRLVMQAWNDIHRGRWAEADSEIAEGAQLARESDQAMWSAVADVAAAMLAALRGDEDHVERALARVGPAAIGQGSDWLASSVDVVRGICDLNAGRAESAYARLRDRLTVSDDTCPWAIDHFADSALLSGKVEEARALLAERGDAAGGRGSLESAGVVYARALLADDPIADQEQALAIAELAPWPVHQARLQLHRGAWLRRRRRVADSREPLRAARDVFEAVGAPLLAERARRELRASGERSRKRDITAWDQLSPQESEIAHMAAKGLSNREIGEQLFLSHRTVGAHLYRIFPKLGVTSRGQLHTVLANEREA